MKYENKNSALVDAFRQGMQEESLRALPERLRGRARWLKERGRIKDHELMIDASIEIELLRNSIGGGV